MHLGWFENFFLCSTIIKKLSEINTVHEEKEDFRLVGYLPNNNSIRCVSMGFSISFTIKVQYHKCFGFQWNITATISPFSLFHGCYRRT